MVYSRRTCLISQIWSVTCYTKIATVFTARCSIRETDGQQAYLSLSFLGVWVFLDSTLGVDAKGDADAASWAAASWRWASASSAWHCASCSSLSASCCCTYSHRPHSSAESLLDWSRLSASASGITKVHNFADLMQKRPDKIQLSRAFLQTVSKLTPSTLTKISVAWRKQGHAWASCARCCTVSASSSVRRMALAAASAPASDRTSCSPRLSPDSSSTFLQVHQTRVRDFSTPRYYGLANCGYPHLSGAPHPVSW